MSISWLTRLFDTADASRPAQRYTGPSPSRFRKTLLTEPTGTTTMSAPRPATTRAQATAVVRCAGCEMPYERELLQACPDCRNSYCPYCDRQYHHCGAMRRLAKRTASVRNATGRAMSA